MSTGTRIARVAVRAPVRKLFDYLIPHDCTAPAAGARVRVPFGPRRLAVGVVMAVVSSTDVPAPRLKPLRETLDADPLLPPSLLELLDWAAAYYHHPIGEVIASAIPTRLRERQAPGGGAQVWKVTPAGAGVDPAGLKRAPVRQRILRALQAAGEGLGGADLGRESTGWREATAALVAKGWVQRAEAPRAPPGPAPLVPGPALSPAQQCAVAAVDACRGFGAFLLQGVTGSGKTEVYLQVLAGALARGEQALVLVPEIGLVPQLAERLRARLGVHPLVLHSDLNEDERARDWLRARDGEGRVVLGTRSAVFAPLPRLGVIIVDEEHDPSYKQQDGFRYSGRDVAVMRASRAGVPVVLGSATPSLETLQRARSGAYRHLVLPERAGGARLPAMELLDLRRLPVEDGLTPPLRAALAETLGRGEQALLFLNRRGFAPVWMCFDCAWVAPCPRCDARLTLHRASGRLRCHHCGSERPLPPACPACGGGRLRPVGEGTERVEQALARAFPRARLIRIDRDSTRARGSLEAKFERVRTGDADILIGTQMLSKGHDFPEVTLVGVLNADQGLYGSDFRAAERLVQQVVQVAGRAGRAAKPGRVLVQTHHPGHPLFAALLARGYDAFADYALEERRAAAFPPFSHLALLRAESPRPGAATAFLGAARAAALVCPLAPGVELMEPVPSPMERRAGRHRAQLLVQAANRSGLHALLAAWVPRLDTLEQARRVRWSLDVDPADLY